MIIWGVKTSFLWATGPPPHPATASKHWRSNCWISLPKSQYCKISSNLISEITLFEISPIHVTAVTVPVERDPSYIISQHHTRGHEQLGKLTNVKSKLVMSLELYATICQQVDRVLRIHVLTAHIHPSQPCKMQKCGITNISSAKQQNFKLNSNMGS